MGININYLCFEPDPQEFRSLTKNVFPGRAFNLALWNHKFEVEFYISRHNADSSVIAPNEFDDKILIPAERLDQSINSNVKLLKLEAEGVELEILEGIGEKLAFIEYISADFGFERGLRQASTLPAVSNYLSSRNFSVVGVGKGRLSVLYRNSLFRGGGE